MIAIDLSSRDGYLKVLPLRVPERPKKEPVSFYLKIQIINFKKQDNLGVHDLTITRHYSPLYQGNLPALVLNRINRYFFLKANVFGSESNAIYTYYNEWYQRSYMNVQSLLEKTH